VFCRGSNVLEYWLANAEGFVVRSRGSRVGVVDGVVLDPARGRASALVLSSPVLHRRRVVLASTVEAVDPEARSF
jgi:sporulation protein YlmC with PRC-barrel domain